MIFSLFRPVAFLYSNIYAYINICIHVYFFNASSPSDSLFRVFPYLHVFSRRRKDALFLGKLWKCGYFPGWFILWSLFLSTNRQFTFTGFQILCISVCMILRLRSFAFRCSNAIDAPWTHSAYGSVSHMKASGCAVSKHFEARKKWLIINSDCRAPRAYNECKYKFTHFFNFKTLKVFRYFRLL